MQLNISYAEFKKLANYSSPNDYLHSHIDFELAEWHISFPCDAEHDVEIKYLFQFDVNHHTVHIYCNGFDENILRYDILNHLDVSYTLS